MRIAVGARGVSWWTGGLAGVGVLVTHWLTYRLLHLEGHLHETGHGHLGVTSALVVGLFVAGALRFCALGLRGGPTPGFGSVAARLTAVQAVAWLAMETVERAANGSLSTLDDHAVVVVGLGVQVLVALAAAALVRMTAWAIEAVVARRRRPRLPRPAAEPRVRQQVPRFVHRWGAQGVRGPPRPVVAAS